MMINPSPTNSSENRNPSLFLKRATSIIEKTEPITNVNTLVFLKNEKNKKFGDSFLDISEMLDFFDRPEDNDNSFIMEDKKEKEKIKKIIEIPKLSIELKEPNTYISADDICFEEILRKTIEFDKFKYVFFEKYNMELFNILPNRPFDTVQLVDSEDKELEDLKDER